MPKANKKSAKQYRKAMDEALMSIDLAKTYAEDGAPLSAIDHLGAAISALVLAVARQREALG